MYAYCGNNPVSRIDIGGHFWDIVIDVVSLGVSIVDVALNPDDPMAWLGVAADVASMAIPFVTGGGAIVKVATKTDDVVAAARAAEKITDAGKVIDGATDIASTSKVISQSTKSARSAAVRKAWKNELALVEATGKGTRNWTVSELDELLNTGKVKGYDGHHMKSVKGRPDLAGDPSNIQFLTRKEHYMAHGGNWRNVTTGRYIP